MARVARLIIYDTDSDRVMVDQLSKSLAEGIHNKGKMKITVMNLSSEPILDGYIEQEEENLEQFDSDY